MSNVPAGSVFIAFLFWISVGGILYTYFGYPILIFLLARLRLKAAANQSVQPSVTLLIAAYNEEMVIEEKIKNSLAIDYPKELFQILIVSDGSADKTPEIAKRYTNYGIESLHEPARCGKMAAINRAWSSVRGEIVVFSDANTFLQRDAVRALVRNFASEDLGCVSGDVTLVGDRALLGRSEDLYYRYERWLQHAESDIGSMIGADGALYASGRRLFTPPADDTILDDMAIPMAIVRAGRRVIFEPTALAHEQGSETAMEEFARKSRVIAGAVQFLSRRDSAVPWTQPQVVFSLVSHKALRWLSPAFGICGFVASLVLAQSSLAYAGAAAAQVFLLIFGLAGCAPVLRRSSAIAVAHYFCLVQAAAAVGFVRGLGGRQPVLWRRFNRAPMELT